MSESRRPERQAWVEWNRDDSFATAEIDGVGVVESWYDVLVVSLPLVTFRGTIVLHADGTGVTSDSTLRFRTRDEIVESLEAARFRIRRSPQRRSRLPPGTSWPGFNVLRRKAECGRSGPVVRTSAKVACSEKRGEGR